MDSGRWRGQSTGGTAAALPAGCVRRLKHVWREKLEMPHVELATPCQAGISRQRFAYFAQKSAKVN